MPRPPAIVLLALLAASCATPDSEPADIGSAVGADAVGDTSDGLLDVPADADASWLDVQDARDAAPDLGDADGGDDPEIGPPDVEAPPDTLVWGERGLTGDDQSAMRPIAR